MYICLYEKISNKSFITAKVLASSSEEAKTKFKKYLSDKHDLFAFSSSICVICVKEIDNLELIE